MPRAKCFKCGCTKQTMIQAKMKDGIINFTTRWFCIDCFMPFIAEYAGIKDEEMSRIMKERGGDLK